MPPPALGEPTRVVDVRDRHVVNATRDSATAAVAHHRDVDYFRDFAGEDSGKVTVIARRVFGSERHFSAVGAKLEVAPD